MTLVPILHKNSREKCLPLLHFALLHCSTEGDSGFQMASKDGQNSDWIYCSIEGKYQGKREG